MTPTAIPETTGEVVNAEVVAYQPPPEEERNGKRPRGRQLRFDIGGEPPNHNTLKLTADLSIEEPLKKGSEVRIQVTNSLGEVIATSAGNVSSVNFKDDYQDGYVVGCDRIHTVKL